MDKTNAKILTISAAASGLIIGFTFHLLIQIFAGAFGWVARASDSDFVRHVLPVMVGIGVFLFLQMHPAVKTWAEEVIVEVKKVVWPPKKDTTAMTIVVVVMVLISSVIISTFDVISGYVISALMK